MPHASIHADSILHTVMNAYPATVAVFLRRRMHCPGCMMSPFEDVAEAARNYAVETDDLIRELRDAAGNAAAGGRS